MIVDALPILAIAIFGISAMISTKMKIDKHKKWWLPLLIGGITSLLMIGLFIISVLYFIMFFEDHCAPYLN